MPDKVTVGDIVQALGGKLTGDKTTPIQALAPLDKAIPGDISFLSNKKYKSELAQSQASCIVLQTEDIAFAGNTPALIVCPHPYLYYAYLSQWWAKRQGLVPAEGFIHPSAVIDSKAQVHPSAHIGPLCVVQANAHIDAQTVLHAHVFVGYNCHIGKRCIVYAGAVIGSDGFGLANTAGRFGGDWVKIAQLGAVQIGDDVEIGANTCIDRGALEDTVIENGVKIDNMVQIAHNVRIGAHSALAGQVGIAGSTQIGAYCTLAGSSKVTGHVCLGDRVHISGAASVHNSINNPGQYTGSPAQEHGKWQRNAATFNQLYALRERVRALEKQIKQIQGLNKNIPNNNQTVPSE